MVLSLIRCQTGRLVITAGNYSAEVKPPVPPKMEIMRGLHTGRFRGSDWKYTETAGALSGRGSGSGWRTNEQMQVCWNALSVDFINNRHNSDRKQVGKRLRRNRGHIHMRRHTDGARRGAASVAGRGMEVRGFERGK